MQYLRFRQFAHLNREVGKKLALGVHTKEMQQPVIFVGQIVIGKRVRDKREADKKQPFQQLHRNDCVECWRPLFNDLGIGFSLLARYDQMTAPPMAAPAPYLIFDTKTAANSLMGTR